MTKEMVLEALEQFADEFDSEEFIERLVFMEKVEKARQQADQGLGITIEEVEEKFRKKWANR